MAIPSLTVSEGTTTVKRGDTTTTVRKGDPPFPLQICDHISGDTETTEYVVTGATPAGEKTPDTITVEGQAEIHYKENRGDKVAFELIGGFGGFKTYLMLYIDPVSSLILETPLIQADFSQAVYLVSYDPRTRTSRFTVLQGLLITAPVDNPSDVTRIPAGSEATYVRNRLRGVSSVNGYPQAPADLFLADNMEGSLLSWPTVTADVSGNPVEVATYNVYRSDNYVLPIALKP